MFTLPLCCCCCLPAVWLQVGTHDAEEARARVVKEMLSAVKGACEACVKQEKEQRDAILAHIQQAKVRARHPQRALGVAVMPSSRLSVSFTPLSKLSTSAPRKIRL